MKKIVNIGGNDITLAATVWTLLEYKKIFKKDWYAARSEQLNDVIKALKFQEDYAGLTDEQFNKLPQFKQDEYWRRLQSAQVDTEFTLNTIYAMAVSGGYKGSPQGFFSLISPKDLSDGSEFMKTVAELIEELLPEVKKNNQ